NHQNASFKGKILEDVDFDKPGIYRVNVKGRLRIHGVSRERTISGRVTVNKDKLLLHTVFNVKTEDHRIDIPRFMDKQVCENVRVTVNAELIKKSL
ncbi:MAG: YceI family protein, partial [Mucilaginibacter polytrichastri]|nr:YceI family protein [Mucilaginibacter polytrichastri]